MRPVFALLFVLVFSGVAKSDPWENIIPLVSTRTDVENKLGPCKDGYPWICSYRMSEQTVTVSYYTDGNCANGNNYSVEAGTVMSISVTPFNRKRFERFEFANYTFVEEPDDELPGIIHLFDRDRGLWISVDNGFVRAYDFYPTKEDKNRLACTKNEMSKRSSLTNSRQDNGTDRADMAGKIR